MGEKLFNHLRPVSPNQPWVVSVANENIVAKYLPDQSEPIFKNISFISKQVCTLIVNEKEKLVINPDLGLEMDTGFKYIYNLQIEEDGIEYYFLAGY